MCVCMFYEDVDSNITKYNQKKITEYLRFTYISSFKNSTKTVTVIIIV